MSPGERSRLFREVNDRIYELLESTDPELPGGFLCECGWDCRRRVELLPAAFAMLRETGEAVLSPDCSKSSSLDGGRRPWLSDGVPALG